MKIIAGLGNYGKEYDKTRHNIGFEVIDSLADKNNINVSTFEHHALVGKGFIGDEKVLLVKPQTYMNLSGVAISALLNFYKEDEENLIVIYDDVYLDPGKLRIRSKGSAGGHNGIKNIIQMLGTETFARIRIGVGKKPPEWDLVDWVLGHFGKEDEEAMAKAVKKAAQGAECIANVGIGAAMNRFNG